MSEYIYTSNGEPLANGRGEILLARAGEVVRCRDCKYSDKGYWCRYFGKYGDLPTVTPDDFCSWGVKK